ncbi:Cupredoxin, partial [Chaetomium tenue]
AAAATIPMSVGKNGLTFEPNMIHAQEGDVVEFRFWPRNHSVVAGHFNEACRPASENGFFSGFFPTQPDTVNAEVFRVTVTHTNPVPVYCSQNTGQHCKNGMVAVINPAGVGRLTLAAYAALARAAGNATSPPGG